MGDANRVTAVVRSRRDVSPGLWILRIAPEERVSFLPGQYLIIGVTDGSHTVERPYSVASSPRSSELEFFVELVPEGKLTPHLYQVSVGEPVTIRRQAKGRFLFDRVSGRTKHFMAATVTGLAPFLSMLRELSLAEAEGAEIPRTVTLLQSASLSAEFGYLDELRALAARHAWLRYIPTVSRIWDDPSWTGETGRVEDVLRKYLDMHGLTPADTTTYLCGHPQMIVNAGGILRRAGFDKEFIKEERYWPET